MKANSSRGQSNWRLRKLNQAYRVSGAIPESKARQIESDVFLALCEAVNTPTSLAQWLRFKYGELLQLVEKRINHEHYDAVRVFEGDYLVVSFFSKYRDFKLPIDREVEAKKKWLLAEERCRQVNDLFRKRWNGEISNFSHSVEEIYHLSRQKITRFLGRVPDDILQHGRFGPGSDTSTSGVKVSRFYKYNSPGTCTPGVLSLLNQFDWDDRRHDMVDQALLVNHSKLTFVPKTAVIDRSICVEPRWNIFFQLSVAHCMERRLKSFGYDITDQSRNTGLASRAYSDGLATIDLSSASDTISKNLVLDMFPDDWSDVLFKLRCPVTKHHDVAYKLEKISSMGNGYTFPLETMIFAAFAESTCEYLRLPTEDVAVYGDDIIVPEEAAKLLLDVLDAFGFSANAKKTCIKTTFYESCGSDFYKGKNVRPIFLKERIRNVEGTIRLANQITRFSRRTMCFSAADGRYLAAVSPIIRRVPKDLRFFGPPNAGDAVFHVPFDRATPRPAGNGWEGYFITGLVVKPLRFYRDGESLLFAKLDGPDLPGNYVVHRGMTETRVEEVFVHKYEDFAVV